MTARLARLRIAPWVFGPAAVVVVVFSLFAIVFPDAAETFFGTVQSSMVTAFNWYFVAVVTVFLGFMLFVGFSRFGDIRLGRDDDEPDFSLGSWFALLFAAGVGVGLVFYGVSEPLSHFVSPRPGVQGLPGELAQRALTQTYLHWGIHGWAIFAVVGLALAYTIHRRGRRISIRWALEPLLGDRVRGGWGNAIDAAALVGTLFGVATSLGLGVVQLSAGVEAAGLFEAGSLTQVVIIGVITVFVLWSVLSGVQRGIKWLSSANLVLAGLLLAFVLVVGGAEHLLRAWAQSLGVYVQDLIGLGFSVGAFQGAAGEQWQATWTSFFWGWWISWAPFVGVFIARVSRGRTVRQFVLGVLLVPTMIAIAWFAVLGGAAVNLERTQPGSMTQADGSVDLEGALFQLFSHLPATPVLTIGAIVLIAVFFITSSDSGALVMGMLATGGDQHPARWVRVFFTLATAVLAIALLIAGGLQALRTAAIIIALPFSIVMLLICGSTIVAFRRERRAQKEARRTQMVEGVGEEYGLERTATAQAESRAPSRP
ncbi:BCCT family transporter [Microbacterium sp. LRZ72]|uniref:BCCT family transporter n=1 Tax=Microbacterium sp. LRZ72 TaxID=2942481 RepID=UPI0029A79961|nr:BCCT family transporter [Microbacterium sp. LRZ72]MDX2377972.1 BCCT family transporter [Microbacterium sp. LRZ72]